MKIRYFLLVSLVYFSMSEAQTSKTYIVEAPTSSTTEVFVEGTPPADLQDEMDPTPGPGYVWKSGYWKWDGKWKWKKGQWVLKPHQESVWVAGFWKKKHHHWEYVDGHWE